MTVIDHEPPRAPGGPTPRPAPWRRALAVAAVVLVAGSLVARSSTDLVGDDRIGSGRSGSPSTVRPPLWGIENWTAVITAVFVVVAGGMLIGLAVLSLRRRKLHPNLVVFAALVGVAWVDPLGNWATFAVFDPRFLHPPSTWTWINHAPGIEPVMVFVGYPFLFLLLGLVARAAHRRVVLPRSAWARRRPVGSALLVGVVLGAILDFLAQVVMMRTGMYVYAQWAGPAYSRGIVNIPILPVFYDAVGIAVTTALLWRDDRGRSAAEVAVERSRWGTGRSSVAPILVGWVALSACLLAVIAVGGILRAAGAASTTFDGPWPFPEMLDIRPA